MLDRHNRNVDKVQRGNYPIVLSCNVQIALLKYILANVGQVLNLLQIFIYYQRN